MGKYVFERHRREYLFTRALVRTVLSSYAPEIAPAKWRFVKNEYDRPSVAPGLPPLTFNLSNSEGVIVCGVSRHGEVGVDIEPWSRGDQILGVADGVFSPRELADLAALPLEEKRRHAVKLWTSKEAYIKARAIGLSLPLKEFSMLTTGGFAFHAGLADAPERWRLSHHAPLPTHLVAVCAENLRGIDPGEVVMKKTVPLSGRV